jgi:hypothetical protein
MSTYPTWVTPDASWLVSRHADGEAHPRVTAIDGRECHYNRVDKTASVLVQDEKDEARVKGSYVESLPPLEEVDAKENALLHARVEAEKSRRAAIKEHETAARQKEVETEEGARIAKARKEILAWATEKRRATEEEISNKLRAFEQDALAAATAIVEKVA